MMETAGAPDPVARYFAHALGDGAELARGTRIEMRGRIKVGAWLPFRADWQGDGRALDWRATVGVGPLKVLRVRDRFAAGNGSMDIRLFGRLELGHSEDEDTARSAAGRAAGEAALWAPACLLPERGVAWRAEGDDHIVAVVDVPPERPEIHIQLDEHGAVASCWFSRWTNAEGNGPDYVPFGVDVEAEHSFGPLTIASRITAGWWYGTPRYRPFFKAEIVAASAL
jgi:uncharacterized protein DUF6544